MAIESKYLKDINGDKFYPIASATTTYCSDGTSVEEKIAESGGITVDSVLSETSENPVQNKVITKAIGDIGSALDTINREVV